MTLIRYKNKDEWWQRPYYHEGCASKKYPYPQEFMAENPLFCPYCGGQ